MREEEIGLAEPLCQSKGWPASGRHPNLSASKGKRSGQTASAFWLPQRLPSPTLVLSFPLLRCDPKQSPADWERGEAGGKESSSGGEEKCGGQKQLAVCPECFPSAAGCQGGKQQLRDCADPQSRSTPLLQASAHRNRIIGGEECSVDKHPWLSLMFLRDMPMCSAVLLNQDWVITAAHCYTSENIEIWLGVHSKEVSTGYEQIRNNKNCCFNTRSQTALPPDIMLIQLSSSVDFNEYVTPLALPTSCPSAGAKCEVMGWGSNTAPQVTYPDVPYCTSVKITSDEKCQAAYPGGVNENMVCAGDKEESKGACKGDSGGPLICNGTLQGIVSFGNGPCTEPSHPAVYTSVCKNLGWIKTVLAGDQAQCFPCQKP
ncbi:thrombin-like enzyme elegaxobin-1 [Hemicordylus capensis]|uniref:thrombin-like enzyme elegaxobin-1 n=1 Tax=Hemicordylus capensis TaxID=884348 RepID=UPI002302B7F8|nr:thrombin-like enzyme elegaxobin-1 [Hemicordylus capensis]